jgi:hypothetical protein
MFSSIVNILNPSMIVLGETHIEGHIIQDTIWTLTDSPFVIVKDVFVEANATLTIEPGVEVRFGGNFSLFVKGKLTAIGTEEKPIIFTSNKLQPDAGDWITINFTCTQLSRLEHCIVKYAENGVTIENGNVLITRSNITCNLQNGINLIGYNTANIFDNRIENNLNGILVAGNSSGAVIQQNLIYLNNETGIRLYADNLTLVENILISSNILSTNSIGIYIYGQVNANITRNSIAYNELGISYENAANIKALHYNDVYGNTLGGQALSSEPVDAEYNYWGDRSGPYHVSLNPSGKGNPVQSNGTDFDFIPFLTINNSYINQRPVANLVTDKLRVAPIDDVTFVATLSEDDRQVYKYFFNFGDGTSTSWTTISIFKHEYNSEGTYIATLIVMDDFGATSENIATVTINVQSLTSLNVHLELDNYTVKYGDSVSITVQVTDGIDPVEGASITLISVKDGIFQPLSGFTDLTGQFSSIFTAPNSSRMEYVRIIATASKDGYTDGSDYRYLQVLPPLLAEILVDSPVIESNEGTDIRVYTTYNGEPIDDAYVQLHISDGDISQTSGYTDADGFAVFDFTAPQTMVSTNVTVEATVSKIGYISEQTRTQIRVNPRKLDIQVTTEPSPVASGETSMVTALVTYKETPVDDDAYVQLYFNFDGNITEKSGYTTDGIATFVFTAPLVSVSTTVNITATASMDWYISAEAQAQILTVPKTFEINVTTTPSKISSEETSTITISVIHDGMPLADANVTILSDGEGEFNIITKLTNEEGKATFIFTAPTVTEKTNITITATVTKLGYEARNGTTTVEVEQGTLTVVVIVDPYLSSEENSITTVFVRRNGVLIPNATVFITASSGIFSQTTCQTDSNGQCTFLFTAPTTASELSVAIVANATKLGFKNGIGEAMVTVTPKTEGGGLNMTVFLIIIPILIAVVILILFKLKIITISPEEE